MTLEPPPGYVDFVARNLAPLRRDAARVVGDESDADVLYQDVLTDVAARWSWLQLGTALGRSGVADTYLNRAFARRSERWHAGQTDVRSAPDIQVWRADTRAPRRVRSNAAARLAPYLRSGSPARVGPVGEAAVAWWHAYEARRRRRILAGCLLGLLLVALIARAQHELDAANASAPPPVTVWARSSGTPSTPAVAIKVVLVPRGLPRPQRRPRSSRQAARMRSGSSRPIMGNPLTDYRQRASGAAAASGPAVRYPGVVAG
jgi:hypothetical protein